MHSSYLSHAFQAHRPVQCRLGGNNQFGDGNGRQQPNKLIIPGNQGNSSRQGGGGGSLILPGSPGSTFGGGTPTNTGNLKSDGHHYSNFRPPPGFMDSDKDGSTEIKASPEEMLNRLQSQSGHWHQLAKLFPPLLAKGYDTNTIEELTGLERKLQNVWTNSAHIYDSLKKSGKVPAPILSHFDVPGGENLLIELRFLSIDQRIDAVTYIVENSLSDVECQTLARSIKEHERRNGARDGFSKTSADCLAFKYYRDALECRRQEDIEQCVQKALSVVVSDAARDKILSTFTPGSKATSTKTQLPTSTLTSLRLTKEEAGYRPIALVGDLSTCTADAVRSAPKVSQEGFFGFFTIPADSTHIQWIPLPTWSILTLAKRPAALYVTDCAQLPSLRESSAAKSDNDMRKLQGPGLLVIDAEAGAVTIDPGMYYLLANDNGGVEIVDGVASQGKEENVLGPVLFLARPPARDATGVTTAELLSL